MDLYNQGKYDEAIKALDKAIELYPEYSPYWYLKGEAFRALSSTTEADTAFTKAKELGNKG